MSPRGANADARGTIKSSREIQAIFGDGTRVAHPLAVALIANTPEGRGQTGRVAFVAGKKLGGAVLRNRSKRVMREAVRRAGGPWPGRDVVLIARAGTATAGSDELAGAIGDIAGRAGLSS